MYSRQGMISIRDKIKAKGGNFVSFPLKEEPQRITDTHTTRHINRVWRDEINKSDSIWDKATQATQLDMLFIFFKFI